MKISHWGIFPGLLRQPEYADGSACLSDPCSVWDTCDWDFWLSLVEMVEAIDRDEAVREARFLKRYGVKFH